MLKKFRGKDNRYSVLNNPFYKFRRFWVDLSDQEKKDVWNILTVLRGEDGGSVWLKSETTGRIRYEIFGCDRVLDKRVICTEGQIEAEDIRGLRKIFLDDKQTNAHWRHHLISAIKSLSKFVFKERLNDLYKVIGLDRS